MLRDQPAGYDDEDDEVEPQQYATTQTTTSQSPEDHFAGFKNGLTAVSPQAVSGDQGWPGEQWPLVPAVSQPRNRKRAE